MKPNIAQAVELAAQLIEGERAKGSTKYNAETMAYGREILKALTGTSQIPAARKVASEGRNVIPESVKADIRHRRNAEQTPGPYLDAGRALHEHGKK